MDWFHLFTRLSLSYRLRDYVARVRTVATFTAECWTLSRSSFLRIRAWENALLRRMAQRGKKPSDTWIQHMQGSTRFAVGHLLRAKQETKTTTVMRRVFRIAAQMQHLESHKQSLQLLPRILEWKSVQWWQTLQAISPYNGKLMRVTGVSHSRRGRPTLRSEDILWQHMGIDWQAQAAQPDWNSQFDKFRDAVYKGFNVRVPEHMRPRTDASRRKKRPRIVPIPRITWDRPCGLGPVPRCILLGDSETVCRWLNGEWKVTCKQYDQIMDVVWRICYRWLKCSQCLPASVSGNFCKHVHREYNTDADAAAGLHRWSFTALADISRVRQKGYYLKVFFDGSRLEDGQTCAGIVILCAPATTLNFSKLCSLSVPLTVQSACQAELAAMTIAVRLVQCILSEIGPILTERTLRPTCNANLEQLVHTLY